MRAASRHIGPAWLDTDGKILDHANTAIQLRRTYVNADRILGRLGASLRDVVEEVFYVTDMDTAFAAAGPIRKAVYGSERPAVASTIITAPASRYLDG